ncbi:MAG: hypothetical protein MHPSP_002375, partial [Paramarteilia canceri]
DPLTILRQEALRNPNICSNFKKAFEDCQVNYNPDVSVQSCELQLFDMLECINKSFEKKILKQL